MKNRILAAALVASMLLSGCGSAGMMERTGALGPEETGAALIVPLDFSGREKTYKIMVQPFSEKAADVPLEILKKESEQIWELLRQYAHFLSGVR